MKIKIIKFDITNVVSRCSGAPTESRIYSYKITFSYEPSEVVDKRHPTTLSQDFNFCIVNLTRSYNIQIKNKRGVVLLEVPVHPIDTKYITSETTWGTEFIDVSSELEDILNKFEILQELEA